MKIYIISSFLACLICQAGAQSNILPYYAPSENYIVKTVYNYDGDVPKPINSITYYDGLGRAKQTVEVFASPFVDQYAPRDIITPIEYDNMGRQARQYLPYTDGEGSRGSYRSNALAQQRSWYAQEYSNDQYAYTETVFEASPLLRPENIWGIGNAFRSAEVNVSISHGTNVENEVLRVEAFSYSYASGFVVKANCYPTNTLHKVATMDEDGCTTHTFTDLQGNVILTRTMVDNNDYNDERYLDTYYAYDNMNRLLFVISPEGSKNLAVNQYYRFPNDFLSMYCYCYKYDGRGNVIEKQLPGAEPLYMIYDKADRLIMSQDGNMRVNNQWVYTVCDDLNRPVYQSLIENVNQLTLDQIRNKFSLYHYNSKYPEISDSWRLFVPFDDSSFEHIATLSETRYGGYKYLIFTNGEPSLVENYYPLHLRAFSSAHGSDFDAMPDKRTTGFLTYGKVALIDGAELTDDFVERAFYYDSKGRVIQTVEKNHLGGISRYSTKYDFIGNVLASHESHNIPTGDEAITYYDLFLTDAGKAKLEVLKVVREITSLSLKEAKELIESTPSLIVGSVSCDLAEEYKSLLEVKGATAVVNGLMIDDVKLTEFTYDSRGRLLSETTTLNDSKPAIVEYVYNELGRLHGKSYNAIRMPVSQDFYIITHQDDFNCEKLNGFCHEYLSREHGIHNWNDFGYFKDGKIDPVYYVGPSRDSYHPVPIYYFPFGIDSKHFHLMADAFYDVHGTYFPISATNKYIPFFTRDNIVLNESEAITETYDYNIRGWLTEKTSDVFNMKLRYYDPQKNSTAKSYTGNITEWDWLHAGPDADNTINTYAFTYDGLSQLKDTKHYNHGVLTNAFTETGPDDGINYDRNGNILRLQRYGSTPNTIDDDFEYIYNGNRLTTLKTNINPTGFTYTYDLNGNCMTDGLNGLNLQYNFLNLVGKVTCLSDSSTLTSYRWLADGIKTGVKGYYNGSLSSGFEYLGSLVYQRNANDDLSLESASFGSGRFKASETDSGLSYTPNYFITDHLGSTRVVVDHLGNVMNRSNYYPYGLQWEDTNAQASNNRYLYNGKELQTVGFPDGTDILDYGARMLNSRLGGRWLSIDPLAEKYYSYSPYVYVGNNPIRRTDPNGMDWWDKVNGIIRGITSNIAPSSSIRENYTPRNTSDYNNALMVTDAVSTLTGALMITEGAIASSAGAAGLAGSGGLMLSGVGAPAAGLTAAGSVALLVAGAIEAGTGAMLMSGAGQNAGKGYNYGEGKNSSQPKEKSINQLQKNVEKGDAPKGIKRFDKGKTPGEQSHVHFKNGSSLNKDGTWKHNPNKGQSITNKQREYLYEIGWEIPK